VSIAFPAILIFLLALPGILLSRAYFHGSKQSPSVHTSITEQIAWGLAWSAFLHGIWIATCLSYGWRIDFPTLLLLLAAPSSPSLDVAIRRGTAHPVQTFAYFASITFGAVVIGRIAHAVVRNLGLDRRYPPLRFETPWYYLLTGERLQFPDAREELTWTDLETASGVAQHQTTTISDEPPLVFVSAVLQQGPCAFIYTGLLTRFDLDSHGRPELLELTLPIRRLMASDDPNRDTHLTHADRAQDPRYYTIAGNYLLLKYGEIKDLNVDYFTWSTQPPPVVSANPLLPPGDPTVILERRAKIACYAFDLLLPALEEVNRLSEPTREALLSRSSAISQVLRNQTPVSGVADYSPHPNWT
jgi:hypothetical protein